METWSLMHTVVVLLPCILSSWSLALRAELVGLPQVTLHSHGRVVPHFRCTHLASRRLKPGAESRLGASIRGNRLRRVDLTKAHSRFLLDNKGKVDHKGNQPGGPDLQCPVTSCPRMSRCSVQGESQEDAGVKSCRSADVDGVSYHPPQSFNSSLLLLGGRFPFVHKSSLTFNPLEACFTVQFANHIAVGPSPTITRPECHGLKTTHEAKHPSKGAAPEEASAADASGDVYELNNVFLDSWGRVFNSTHYFTSGGCALEEVSYGPGTLVLDVDTVVNLVGAANPATMQDAPLSPPLFLSHKDHSWDLHSTAHELPVFLLVMRLFQLHPGTVLATRQAKSYWTLFSQFLPEDLRLRERGLCRAPPGRGTVWRVRRLIQPAFQPCHTPSFALWDRTRRIHLLLPELKAALARAEQGISGSPAYPVSPPSLVFLPSWRIVVHNHVLSSTLSDPPIQVLMRRFFPQDRILIYSREYPFLEDQSIFGQAPLYVASVFTPSALSKLVLMPPASTVLLFQVHQPWRHPTASAVGSLAVQLAAACGVRLYIVHCTLGLHPESALAPRSPPCDPQHILEVFDRVAIDVYSSTNSTASPDGSTALASGRTQRPLSAPILRSIGRARLEAYKDWSECISRQGAWVLNKKPRFLPWVYRGQWSTDQLCDIKHVLRGGIRGNIADNVVRNGKSPEYWKVRDSILYEWQVPRGKCPALPHQAAGKNSSLLRFTPTTFCKHVGNGKTLVFVGDSLTEQMVNSLVNMMLTGVTKPADWAVKVSIPKDCQEWLPDNSFKNPTCKRFQFHHSICPRLTLYFVRNDYITLANPRLGDRQQYSRFQLLKEADVFVLNRGAHYEGNVKFKRDLAAVLRYLRNRFPRVPVIFRNTPPGHVNCTRITKPLLKRQDPESLPKPFHWGQFQEQNIMAREVVEENGHLYMDVDTMTALRGDSHRGIKPWSGLEDCLHYCLPGPLDTWNQLLFNTLLWVA